MSGHLTDKTIKHTIAALQKTILLDAVQFAEITQQTEEEVKKKLERVFEVRAAALTADKEKFKRTDSVADGYSYGVDFSIVCSKETIARTGAACFADIAMSRNLIKEEGNYPVYVVYAFGKRGFHPLIGDEVGKQYLHFMLENGLLGSSSNYKEGFTRNSAEELINNGYVIDLTDDKISPSTIYCRLSMLRHLSEAVLGLGVALLLNEALGLPIIPGFVYGHQFNLGYGHSIFPWGGGLGTTQERSYVSRCVSADAYFRLHHILKNNADKRVFKEEMKNEKYSVSWQVHKMTGENIKESTKLKWIGNIFHPLITGFVNKSKWPDKEEKLGKLIKQHSL